MHEQWQPGMPGKRDPRSCCNESLEQRPLLMSWNADSASWWHQLRGWCCRRGTQALCCWETRRQGMTAWRWSARESEANEVHRAVVSRDRTSRDWIQSVRTAADQVEKQVAPQASHCHNQHVTKQALWKAIVKPPWRGTETVP